MHARDWTFQKVFSKVFVYNILFEDAEVDERFLGVDPNSNILAITGAGCGVAGHLSQHAQSLDCVDINKHHLALAALKCSAAQRLQDYSTFYELVGMGRSDNAQNLVKSVVQDLPAWLQQYWKKNWQRFSQNMYSTGMTARMLTLIRQFTGLDAAWILGRAEETPEERKQRITEDVFQRFDNPISRGILSSPAQLVALGINFQQRDRIVQANGMSMFDFFHEHLKNLAETDVMTNWFIWWALAGGFNHNDQNAVPPYLRADRHERSVDSPTRVRFHNKNIFDILGSAGPNTWSHYTLCDAIDWMPEPIQRHLLNEIVRTGRDGGVVLYRSVEPKSIVEELGMTDRLTPMVEESQQASALDRSRQYQRVNFYRINN